MSTQYGFALVPELLTWTTTEDWDAATSESGVEHTNVEGRDPATVRLGSPASTGDVSWWQLETDGTPLTTHEVQTTDVPIGPSARHITGNTTTNAYSTYIQPIATPSEVAWWLKFPTAPSGGGWWFAPRLASETDPEITGIAYGSSATDNIAYRSGTTSWTDTGQAIPAGTWFRTRLTLDATTDTYSGFYKPLGGTETTLFSNVPTANSLPVSSISSIRESWSYATGAIEAYHQYDTLHAPSGSLTTATKTFTDPAAPLLAGLNYSLNGGSITLRVVGSPGQPGEETVTQVLDGASAYPLAWSNTHTDFRVAIDLSTPDASTTPTVSEVSLNG